MLTPGRLWVTLDTDLSFPVSGSSCSAQVLLRSMQGWVFVWFLILDQKIQAGTLGLQGGWPLLADEDMALARSPREVEVAWHLNPGSLPPTLYWFHDTCSLPAGLCLLGKFNSP